MSTLRFGCSSSSRPTSARSSAAQPTWAPTNVVRGCRATSRPNAASSASNGGNPGASRSSIGRVGQKCQSGLASSSSQRSLCGSSGSKNAIGSAMWMTTGRPRSAAVVQSGSSRASSMSTRRPSGSRARSPSSFQTLSPRAPRAAAIAQPRRLGLAEGRVRGPAVVVEPGEHGDAIRIRDLPALDLGREGLALAAVEIDDHLDAGRVERGDQLGRRAGRPVAAERGPEVVVRVDDREPRPSDLVGRHAQRRSGPEVGESEVVHAHSEPRMTTWPRWRGASGSQPRVRASSRASACARVEEQRQPRRRVQPASGDPADLAGRSRRLDLVAGDQPGVRAETRGLLDDGDFLGRRRRRPPGRRPASPARRPRSGRAGTRAARRRSWAPGSSRSA